MHKEDLGELERDSKGSKKTFHAKLRLKGDPHAIPDHRYREMQEVVTKENEEIDLKEVDDYCDTIMSMNSVHLDEEIDLREVDEHYDECLKMNPLKSHYEETMDLDDTDKYLATLTEMEREGLKSIEPQESYCMMNIM